MSFILKTIVAALEWVVDMSSVVRGPGKQIDWDLVSDRYLRGAVKVTVGVGGIAIGATTLPVVALPGPLKKGQKLRFGELAEVAVVVGAAGAAGGATTVPVDPLSGPIPNGTVLHFGTNKFAVLNAAAAAGAISLTTLAIPTALVDNDAATFQGGPKLLEVDADAAQGAISVTVEDAQFALAAGESAWIQGIEFSNLNPGAKHIPSGTIMCTIAASGKMVPRRDRPGSETADAIIETDASSDSKAASLTGYGRVRGANVFENRLPDAIDNGGTVPTDYKTELATNGVHFIWGNVSSDSRGE